MLKHIKGEEFDKEVINSNEVVLVDFFATWCGPCKMLGEVLERMANSREEFNIVKIDVDESQELAMKYQVSVVPTMVIFKNGKPQKTIEGFKTEEELVDEISKYR